jgi:hypothetical protein
MHTHAIFILKRKEGETGKQQERQRERVCEWGSVAERRNLASVIKLTVGKNPVTNFWDKPERITIFWETILMEKWDRKEHKDKIFSHKNIWRQLVRQLVAHSPYVPGKPLQPSQMLVGKSRSLPQSGAPERYFTWVGSSLTCKHWTRLKRLARDKRFSLL